MIDDEFESSLFDELEEDVSSDPALAWSNSLIVGAPLAGTDALERLEREYRYGNLCHPVQFVHDHETIPGLEVLENEETFAKAMQLAPGSRVTLKAAMAWIRTNTAPDGKWLGG